MDSISEQARATFAAILQPIAEQDSTDFAKALRTSRAPWVLAVGFLGARVDHTLACLSTLAESRAPCVLLSETDCVCVLPERPVQLALPLGSRVSLWPLGPARGTSAGLHWPVDGLAMAPGGRVGTSNRSDAPEVTLAFEGGPVAVILEADALEAMLNALGFEPRAAEPRTL
jgi:thiamine pyrophosphokinase